MPVYLDHAATTPLRPEARDALVAALGVVGNPSSIHTMGQHAKRLLEEARETIASGLGADPIEVVFTSTGTEAVNLAIKGLYWRRQQDALRPVVVVPDGEHHATIDTVEWLERHEGAEIVHVPLDADGRVDVTALEAVLEREGQRVAVVSMLWASNEIGTIQPVEAVAALAARYDVPLHVDAIAAYGHVPIDLKAVRAASGSRGATGLVAVSVSAHKIGGPVGIAALVLARSAEVEPLLHGGGQQRRLRSGTQDLAAAVSFAAASSVALADLDAESARLGALRDRLVAGVAESVPGARLNGDAHDRLPGNAHFSFEGCEGDSLLFLLDASGVSVSTGSACQAGVAEPSHVLLALGRSEVEARGALRVTLGHTTTDDDVDAFLAALPAAHAQASRAGMAARSTSFDR
ncbi:cysteine desulfurase family protein [Agromyces atrinae]|uniref:Cysteine desulfurase n=1 Tax=Agromyces atrinae TaxID=592376 RepID=A0A4V1R2H8_9MICO|nr:cysteine desulfurase family protein [Agromyces atrinae]NYD66534.1 cysteine desulfurase [Agromyces atrinae]RXZ87206.1 cysteine desulfurase [Agromyces atrinae]